MHPLVQVDLCLGRRGLQSIGLGKFRQSEAHAYTDAATAAGASYRRLYDPATQMA
jgi:hypothetical protein